MSTELRCTAAPISWLRLEQLHAKELPDAEAKEIRAHLDECAACAACLARIAEDDGVALPPLPSPAPPTAKVFTLRRAAPALTAFAVAAGILLFLRRTPPPIETDGGAGGAGRVKGGDVAFTLVRDDETVFADATGSYRDGDRFKAVVTCAPGMDAWWDVAVYEPALEPAFPLAAPGRIACGNSVPLPGAFRLTGSAEITVCLVWTTEGELDRATKYERLPAWPAAGRVCKVLTPR